MSEQVVSTTPLIADTRGYLIPGSSVVLIYGKNEDDMKVLRSKEENPKAWQLVPDERTLVVSVAGHVRIGGVRLSCSQREAETRFVFVLSGLGSAGVACAGTVLIYSADADVLAVIL